MRNIFAEFDELHVQFMREILSIRIADLEDKVAARGTTDERFKERMDNLKTSFNDYVKKHPKTGFKSFQQWLQSMHKDFKGPSSEGIIGNDDVSAVKQELAKRHQVGIKNDPGEIAKQYYNAKWKETKPKNVVMRQTQAPGESTTGQPANIYDTFHHPEHANLTKDGHRRAGIGHYKKLKQMQKEHGLSHNQFLQTNHPHLQENFLTHLRPEYLHHYEQLNQHRAAGGAPSAWIGPKKLKR